MTRVENDIIFKALADPTRRDLLDLLRDGPKTTSDLGSNFDITRFGIMKHLKVLEEAKLITTERRGRERWNYINASTLQKVFERWIKPYESLIASRLIKFADKLEEGINE